MPDYMGPNNYYDDGLGLDNKIPKNAQGSKSEIIKSSEEK